METNPVEQTLDEEIENKEKQKSSSKHDDSPKRQKAAAAGSSGLVVSVRGLTLLNAEMGKKKAKDRSPGADSSTETAGVSCTHIRKGTEHSLLKKVSLNEQWSSCQDCEPDKPVEKQILEDETDRESPAVWMCLNAATGGCGRSENQHAIKHFETPRSEPHCLVLSLDVWSVWCYICDEEVQYSRTGQLAQLITNIKKQVLTDPDKKTSNRKSKKEESMEMNPVEQTLEKRTRTRRQQKSSSHNMMTVPTRADAAAAGALCG
ncbi:hypothetical protein QQF64_009047 [Cirrhinus molitorella]|uniref:UBP-type domain-containing protein n=1 Tax=Cirrhinus molitorella TaxID=172907 RepID=A0ABR3M9B9_9TELE